jgi:hypothetical protein
MGATVGLGLVFPQSILKGKKILNNEKERKLTKKLWKDNSERSMVNAFDLDIFLNILPSMI